MSAAEPAPHAMALPGKRVLVVDDEPDVLEAAAEVMAGAVIDTAATEAEARRKLAGKEYDVVIMDIMGVRGLELLEELRPRGRAPWIMITAHALTPEALRRTIRGQAALFLPKDELARLDEFVREVLAAEGPLWSWLFGRIDFGRHFGEGWGALREAARALAGMADAATRTAAPPGPAREGRWPAAEAATDHLRSPDPAVRRYAITALGLARDPRSIDDFVRAFEDTDPGVREEAVWALAGLGPAARPALEAVRARGGTSADLAAEALRRVDRGAASRPSQGSSFA